MKQAILLIAALACCGGLGCDTQSSAKLILTVGLNLPRTPASREQAAVVATSDQVTPPETRTPPVDDLVAAMQELVAALDHQSATKAADLAPRVTRLIDRMTEAVALSEQLSTTSPQRVQQTRETLAVALERAADSLPTVFAGRWDAYQQATFGRSWDRAGAEKQAISRLVSGYLVAPKLPADVAQVLALHTVTYPHNAMNVELYTTITERLIGEGKVRDGLELARAGLRYCASHADVSRLENRIKQFYRAHPGDVGVPMNFAGPTLREERFVLNSLQGRPVLVVFWSPTEPVASKFMDGCLRLAKRYTESELEVVGVNLGSDLLNAKLWLAERGSPCRQVFSPEKGHAGLENPIARFYGVSALPEFFLLDSKGIVIARGSQLAQIEDQLRQLAPPRLAQLQ